MTSKKIHSNLLLSRNTDLKVPVSTHFFTKRAFLHLIATLVVLTSGSKKKTQFFFQPHFLSTRYVHFPLFPERIPSLFLWVGRNRIKKYPQRKKYSEKRRTKNVPKRKSCNGQLAQFLAHTKQSIVQKRPGPVTTQS